MFDCPCSAEWTTEWTTESGREHGRLTLAGGVRSLRTTASGEVAVASSEVLMRDYNPNWERSTNLGALPPRGHLSGAWSLPYAAVSSDGLVKLTLYEQVGEPPQGRTQWLARRTLTLFPAWPGRLGDGKGKWRLVVDCERPVFVVGLLRSPTGHLANLSAAGARGTP